MTAIVTICVGDKYDWQYVEKLASAVHRNTSLPCEFICFTDEPKHLEHGVAELLPECHWLHGWWWKVWIFSQECQRRVGSDLLWLDLDTIIVDNIDFLLQHITCFTPLSDFLRPDLIGSGVMQIPHHWGVEIWHNLLSDHDKIMGEHQRPPFWGDQRHIELCLRSGELRDVGCRVQSLFPGRVKSYKYDRIRNDAENIGDAAVVCFSGKPTILEEWEKEIPWIRKHWM